MTNRILIVFAAVALICTLPGPAKAQTASPSAQPTDPALKGPSVPDRKVALKTTRGAGFGPDSIEKKKSGGKKPSPPLSMTQFMSSLSVLQTSGFPLTTEQSAKIQSISADFETSTKAYMDKSKAEIDTLRTQLSPADRAMLDNQLARGQQIKVSEAGFGGKKRVAKQNGQNGAPPSQPTATQAPSTSDTAAARTRLVEIYANRPKADDAQARILGVLTGDQLALVEDRLKQTEPSQRKHAGHRRQRSALRSK